ncbi:MAG: hypothetical protein ACFE8B_13180 [Candidatus Hermodarchaeota archaeon]
MLFGITSLLIISSILGITIIPVTAHTEESPFITDLFAGQNIPVGHVIVWNDADYLHVKYLIDDDLTPDDPSDDGVPTLIYETHLHVAESIDGIPQTKKGNPIPGKFDYNTEHNPGVSEYTYQIPLVWDLDFELSIAAHAVVQKLGGLAGVELALPDQVTMEVSYPYSGGPAYFPETIISGGTILDGIYEGWCVDTDNVIYQNTEYTANVYSSYEQIPDSLIEFPENLDLVNWIINQGYVGQSSACGGIFTYGDIQLAIWTLIEDELSTSGLGPWSQCRVNEILAAAYANGEGFEPGCDDYIAIILVPGDGSPIQIVTTQIILVSIGVPCETIDETAWGAGFDFPGSNWATYFTYTVQGETYDIWPEGGTISIAYEDLPIDGGNDWDYNDFVVDIDVLAVFFGTSIDRDLIQINFTIHPEVKLAGYHHMMHLDADTFTGDGNYELYRDDSLISSGVYDHTLGIDIILVPDTNTLPTEVILTISFDEGCEFEFPEWDHNLYHGENLFYDPYLHVINNGQDIHIGDPRMLTVPTDWIWPTPDGNAIWNVYPKVTAGDPPTFIPNWWTP